jgi:serine phosphatase RsbU (regulator of sigma subunit)
VEDGRSGDAARRELEEAYLRERQARARLERLYERERRITEVLQRNAMPETPMDVDGVGFSARYLPGSSEADIGGDWYDVFPGPNGFVTAVVGDVGGKGILAAAQMGQLRSAVRALGMGSESPAELVGAVNRYLRDDDAPYATLAVVTLEPSTAECRFALAGHPPPLVLDVAGRAFFPDGGRNPPLGADVDNRPDDEPLELEPGTMLLLYTDGLVESRTRPLDEGLERLQLAAEAAFRSQVPFLDGLLARMMLVENRLDDVALLSVTVEGVAGRLGATTELLDAAPALGEG